MLKMTTPTTISTTYMGDNVNDSGGGYDFVVGSDVFVSMRTAQFYLVLLLG